MMSFKRTAVCALGVALALALLCPAGPAHAGTSSIGGWGGYQFSNYRNSLDTWRVGVDYEYRMKTILLPIFAFAVQVPFEYAHAEPTIAAVKTNVTTWSVVPTAKAYLTVLPSLHPYAGLGVGYARSRFENAGKHSENDLAWRAVAGAELIPLPMSPIVLFGEYEYSSIKMGDEVGKPDVGGNAVQAGVRLRFF
jgi:opacity protein-like surface antigen